MKTTKIYSNSTQNIFITLTKDIEKDGGKEMEVYGTSIQDTLKIICGADCKDIIVHCPIDTSLPSRLNKGQCIIDCLNVTENNDFCTEMEIYAHYGTPKTLKFCKYIEYNKHKI